VYLPRLQSCPLDFLQAITQGRKSYMYQTGVRQIKVPAWPELATAKIWAQAIQFPGFKDYMPDNCCGDVRTERPFFYGILTTLCPDFVTTLIKDCRTLRKA